MDRLEVITIMKYFMPGATKSRNGNCRCGRANTVEK
jgi:hypothetical protein